MAHAITIAGMPVLSRLYSPESFGVFALFSALAAVSTTLVTLRYETAILLPKENSESVQLLLGIVGLSLTLGLVLAALAWVTPVYIRMILGVAPLGDWLPIAIVTGSVSALLTTGAAWLNRQRAYLQIAKVRLIQSSIALLVGVALGFLGATRGLLWAHIVSVLVGLSLLIPRLPWPRPLPDLAAVRTTLTIHQRAPKFLLPTALLDAITLQLPVFLITMWFSTALAGQFSMAWKIVALPMSLIGSSVAMVFFHRFSEQWPDARAARAVLYRTWGALASIGLVPTALIMYFGENGFAVVLGEPWRTSGQIASILAPMLYVTLIHSPTSTTFIVLGMQKHMLLFGALVAFYRPACLFAGFVYGDLYLGLTLLVVLEIMQMLFFQSLVFRKLSYTSPQLG